jgi:germination protein M
MKRLTVILLVVFLAGCNTDAPVAGTPVTIYTLGGPDDRAALAEMTVSLPANAVPWRFALEEILTRPPFPADVTVTGSNLQDGALNLIFSEEAAALSGFALTLAKACVVLTLSSLDEGIGSVMISIEGQSGEPAVLRASDFVLGALVLADTERRITLFFPDGAGGVRSESRTLVVRETDTVDWYLSYMLEAMIAGPRTEGLLTVLPEGVRLLSVVVEGGVCVVNFSGEFVSNAEQNRTSAGIVLHCLVRSVTAQPGISAVRLLIDGQPLEEYGGTDTSRPLTMADVRIS